MASVKNTISFYMCPANIFVVNMSSAYYVCRIYLIALETTFIMKANTINPDETAPIELSDLGSQYLQYMLQSTSSDEQAGDNCRQWQEK